MNSNDPPLFIPVILGTGRKDRKSEHVANFVFAEAKRRTNLETELIDVRKLKFSVEGPTEETRDLAFAATAERADGFILVVPEYNHGYPGLLKHALDMNLKEYIHKPVAICGVSAGPFGGARVIENLLPVMRELGLVTTFTDVNFGGVGRLFDASGKLLDENYVRRIEKFLAELIWMAQVLRSGRKNIPASGE